MAPHAPKVIANHQGDVVTTPTKAMLSAIAHTTLNDDVYTEDSTTTAFEREMASLAGHEAAAFVLSGTMANQLALRSLLSQPPYAVLASADAHILHWETGGLALLSGAMPQAVRPTNGRYLTVADVQRHACLEYDVHRCPTRVVSIENTASGSVVPLAEMQKIKAWAEENDVKVHVDGARLWEAVAAGGANLTEYAACADALTLDFSKNLGAPVGAMVLGSAELIRRVKRIRKAIGGGMRQAGVLVAPARQAVADNFGMGRGDVRGVFARGRALARTVGDMWTARGGRVARPVETNMVWLDLRASGMSREEWNAAGRRHGVLLDGRRVVLHHQVCDEAVGRLGAAMSEVLEGKRQQNTSQNAKL